MLLTAVPVLEVTALALCCLFLSVNRKLRGSDYDVSPLIEAVKFFFSAPPEFPVLKDVSA